MDSNSPGKLTINQVSELCGVSKTTISRFLNGKYENMSAETRERIAREIEKLDYRPNRSAQRLKASRTMLVGCVIADVSSPFSALLLKGITNICEERGYQVLFADSRNSDRRERRAIEGFLENRVDGLIINTCGENDSYLISLKERRIPTVLADRELMTPNVMDTVSSPNFQASSDCTDYIFRQGYGNIAFFSEKIGNVSPRLLRRMGYVNAAERHGKEPEIYEFSADDSGDCRYAIESFMRKHPGERNAILCSNGTGAQSVLVSANSLGLEFGYELGFCTFDDWNWLQIAKPGISAVALDTAAIGEKSAELLLRRMNGELGEDAPPVYLAVPTEFIERESTPAYPKEK